MNNREKLISYVKHGGKEFLCSPQIGAGAGFDAKLVGKEWLSEVTLQDTRTTCRMFDMVPLYNAGLPDLSALTPDCQWSLSSSSLDDKGRRIQNNRFIMPQGVLENRILEERKRGGTQTKYPITVEEELPLLEFWLDALLEQEDFSAIRNGVAGIREALGPEEALDIQWAMQPYELLCFPDTMMTAIFAMECPEIFRRLMDKILRLDERLLVEVARGGADFVFLGGPGSEMISPKYYEDYLVPYSAILTQMAHQEGLLVYTHICSPIEPMLSRGYYSQMGIDLFETLSEAPVGNVASLEDAFNKLDPSICTRGNIGLDLLLQGKPDEIIEKSLCILQTAQRMGRKHILAASDYLFYDIPEDNVHAMCQAVRLFNG